MFTANFTNESGTAARPAQQFQTKDQEEAHELAHEVASEDLNVETFSLTDEAGEVTNYSAITGRQI